MLNFLKRKKGVLPLLTGNMAEIIFIVLVVVITVALVTLLILNSKSTGSGLYATLISFFGG